MRHVPFSSILLDHVLLITGFPLNSQVSYYFFYLFFQIGIHIPISKEGAKRILEALKLAEDITKRIIETPSYGFISYTSTTLESGKIIESYQVLLI